MRDKSLKSGERQFGGQLEYIEEWHKWRYLQALPYINGKAVLDIGCGVGYGCQIMSGLADLCLGLDDSEEAIEFAKEQYKNDTIDYLCGDFINPYTFSSASQYINEVIVREKLGTNPEDSGRTLYKEERLIYIRNKGHKFPEVITAFEIIEHIEDTDAVFRVFKKLNPETILLSTPHITCPIGGNKFHYRHYGMDDLVDRFGGIGYKIKRAELLYFNNENCLNNFIVVERK